MRVLVCDHQVVFAQSLARVLTAQGADVVAVTHDIDALLTVLGREAIDVCLLDVVFGRHTATNRLADVRAAAPRTRLLLLSGHLDRPLVEAARAAGVDAVADKREPVASLIHALRGLSAGEPSTPHLGMAPHLPITVPRRPANDAERLASFLTPREREVLSALVRGDDTGKMARNLGITVATTRCHIQRVLTKMGAHSRLEVATNAVRYGMVDPESGDWQASGLPATARPARALDRQRLDRGRRSGYQREQHLGSGTEPSRPVLAGDEVDPDGRDLQREVGPESRQSRGEQRRDADAGRRPESSGPANQRPTAAGILDVNLGDRRVSRAGGREQNMADGRQHGLGEGVETDAVGGRRKQRNDAPRLPPRPGQGSRDLWQTKLLAGLFDSGGSDRPAAHGP